ncbi:DinB family protein [Paenibacillus polygoni]|uniref:DinB family protein n=1 Tax=Paenibacillus polygoni TaxID=3050112 RepID=A0ABY8XAM3_9BACL|nr:DinB family protein [Paenibacillus polygoni]WIV21173.1 DinB family protein [Paenibacillus polygoni]
MDGNNQFKIMDITGMNHQISQLVSMMNYARFTTINAVQGLTIDELDYLEDPNSNTIGALLLHIAAVEIGFQIEIFDNRTPNEEELKEWLAAYELGEKGRNEIRGNSLDYYVNKLEQVRLRTLKEFRQKDDNWLYEERKWSGLPSNNYFIWFHVFEDEINHRGQIRWLRQRLPRPIVK